MLCSRRKLRSLYQKNNTFHIEAQFFFIEMYILSSKIQLCSSLVHFAITSIHYLRCWFRRFWSAPLLLQQALVIYLNVEQQAYWLPIQERTNQLWWDNDVIMSYWVRSIGLRRLEFHARILYTWILKATKVIDFLFFLLFLINRHHSSWAIRLFGCVVEVQ